MSEIRLVPDPPKLNLIQRLIGLEAKPLAIVAVALALLSLGLHLRGGQSEAVKAIAEDLVREAMTTGTGGP